MSHVDSIGKHEEAGLGSERTIAIGDVHGCYRAFDTLLKKIAPQRSDTIVMLGDYVDRGPNSKEVIDRLIELSKTCALIPLLGNHEVLMLGAKESEPEREFWLNCGGRATLNSYGGEYDNIPEDHLDFLRSCRRFYETESHFFVHANYQHDLPLSKQSDLMLFWEHITSQVPEPHINGKKAIVGHTPQVDGSVKDVGHLVLLDTYCFGGMWLSGLDLTNRVVWQSGQNGEIYEDRWPKAAR